MANQVILKGGNGRYEEYKAAGALYPGQCIEMDANGEVVVGLLADGAIIVALEDALQGSTIDTAYADDDIVPCYYPIAGDVIQAYSKATQTIAVGDSCGWDADGVIAAVGEGCVAETALGGANSAGDPITVRITGGQAAAS